MHHIPTAEVTLVVIACCRSRHPKEFQSCAKAVIRRRRNMTCDGRLMRITNQKFAFC